MSVKIAISAVSDKLSETVDARFGRAKGFIIYDIETGVTTYVDNAQNLDSAQGAGIQSAKAVINAGAKALVTGNIGPKAYSVLHAANVEVYIGAEGRVTDALEDYKNGKLRKADGANVESHW